MSRVELDAADAPPARDARSSSTRRRARPARAAGAAPASRAGAGRPRSRPLPALRRRGSDDSAMTGEAIVTDTTSRSSRPAASTSLFSDLRDRQPGPRSVDQGAGARTTCARAGSYNPKVVIDGYFDLRYAENPGVAFSMLQDIPGGRIVLTLLAIARLRAGARLPAQDAAREHAPARGAGAGRRRRDRQPHRPRALRQGDRLHRLEVSTSTSGRRSTSPTPRCASASG